MMKMKNRVIEGVSSGVETRRILGSVVKMQAGYYQTIKLLNVSTKKCMEKYFFVYYTTEFLVQKCSFFCAWLQYKCSKRIMLKYLA